MGIEIKPTKIKQSVYLLVPKNIAELIDIGKSKSLTLKIKRNGSKSVLEYYIQ